ncbi:MAG TPA: ABC transporter substrate-binding protein [Methylomirabilota bacterium]|jgi:putative spermidine/putrescine transport system substrate-binding protein|nr:ABC transporter substrate-binding protein [Methylomirabilota bacterium]
MNATRPSPYRISRREVLQLAGAAAAASVVGVPAIGRAQTREMVIGGAAGHKVFMDPVIPLFEKKYNCKIIYEGTRSLVNLQKMQSNKDKPYLSIVLMDDPVMIMAMEEGLLDRLTADKVPALKKLKPAAIHMDGMWVNYQQPWTGIGYNTDRLKGGVDSWTALWDGKYKGRVVVPSLQNTEGLGVFWMAAHLETGKPLKDAQYETDAAFKKLRALKPNLLTIYTNIPQAFNLLEQGEAWMIGSAFSINTFDRKRKGAPVDLSAPKEGTFAMPSGIAKVKNGPQPELSYQFLNEFLGPEYQKITAELAAALPTHVDAPVPPGMPKSEPFVPDWAFVAKHRKDWVERWDKEMGA